MALGKVDMFDLEQGIMQCWSVVDDIDVVYQRTDELTDPDELANALLGLKTLYNMKFERLFDIFERYVRGQADAVAEKESVHQELLNDPDFC